MKVGSKHSPEALSRIAAATRRAMADPSVRQLISDRTKQGMAAARGAPPELRQFRDLWRAASVEVRRDFVTEIILAPIVELLAGRK